MAAQNSDEPKVCFVTYVTETAKGKIKDMLTNPNPECSQCGGDVEMYCVDCAKVFCNKCAVRTHHPGTSLATHSLEEIEKGNDHDTKLITPLLEEILLASFLVCIFFHSQIDQDYFHSFNNCVVTDYVAKGVAKVDSKFFYLIKGSLASYCSIEDSYWRLFLDFWVRDVITDSDSIFLLLASVLSSWIFVGALVLTLVPVLAVAFGLAFAVLRQVERLLPEVFHGATFLKRMVKCLNVVEFVVSDDSDCPPVTKRRFRPAMNFVDFWWYEQDRITRDFVHFYSATASALKQMLTLPMYIVIGMRFFCMMFNGGPWLRMVGGFVCPDYMNTHSEWFSGVSQYEYTDLLLHFSVKETLAAASKALGFPLAAVLGQLRFLQFLAFPLAIIAAVYVRYNYETWLFGKIYDDRGKTKKEKCACQCGCMVHEPTQDDHVWMVAGARLKTWQAGAPQAS